MTPENEIKRKTLDALYQDILYKQIQFPGDIRQIFHEHMNRLTESNERIIEKDGKYFKEIQVSWSEATPEEREKWTCYQQNHVKRYTEIEKT